MGLLGDYMSGMLPADPNQNQAARQGLLQFGAALLGGKGNFGSILGQGLAAGAQGYNGGIQQQQQAALMAAQKQRLDLDNQETQAKIDEPANLAKILGPGPGMPAAGAAPGVRPLSALPQMGAPAAAAAPAPAAQPNLYDTYMAYGDRLTQAGRPTQAKAYYDLAEKLRPKLKETRALTVDGKRVMANVFEDGTTKAIDGFAPDAEKLAFQNTGGSTVAFDPYTGKPVNTVQNTQSPDSVASVATQRRGQDLQHQDALAGDQVPLTVDAILNAAARYNVDGTLPPMGMGKNAAAGRSAILNKAAELKYGVDPEQQRRDQLAFKGDVASQTAAVKAFTSGKLGSSVRSFNVSLSHLDTLGQLADAMGNNDTTKINQVSNFFAKQTGQAAPTNFEAAKHIVADEVVKAIVGSGGALADREAAAKTIQAANSPAQLKGVIGTYKELMRGQLDGLQQQYEGSTGRKDFDRFLSGTAKETRTRHDVKPVGDLPKKAAAAQAYADPAKEQRYQEWKRSQGK